MKKPNFADLSEELKDESKLPILDRSDCKKEELSEAQKTWREDGVIILRKFMPEPLMDEYSAVRSRLAKPVGWTIPCPYLFYDEIKNICLYSPMMEVMKSLIGEDMGLHLNLTGWISTERSWHQDDYLNPEFIMAHYLACWIALEDVNPDSGPFEYVPGSHKWPMLRREKVFKYFPADYGDPLENSHWPTHAEDFVTPACQEEIDRRGAKVERFLGQRGDVLIWHGRLLHQGAKPRIPGSTRKALIAHYSALSKRQDMPDRVHYSQPSRNVSGWYFNLKGRSLDPSEKV